MLIRNALRYVFGEPTPPEGLPDIQLSSTTYAYSLAPGSSIAFVENHVPGRTYNISPNDGRLVFSSDYSTLLRGLSASGAGETEYTITTSDGSDTHETVVTITVTGPIPVTATVNNTTELHAAVAAFVLSGDASGRIVLATAGDFSTHIQIDAIATGELIIEGQSPGETVWTPCVGGMDLDQNAEGITVRYLDFDNPAATLDPLFTSDNVVANRAKRIKINFCNFGALPLDIHDTDGTYETTGDYGQTVTGIRGRYEGLEVSDCVFANLFSAIKPHGVQGLCIYERNRAKNIVSDFIHFNGTPGATSGVASSFIIKDNYATDFVGSGLDGATPEDPFPGPHVDFIQGVVSSAGLIVFVVIEGNVCLYGNGRGQPQFIFGTGNTNDNGTPLDKTDDFEDGWYLGMSVLDNKLICRNGEVQAPGLSNVVGSLCSRNFAVRQKPGVYGGTTASKMEGLPGHAPSALVDSLGETFGGANGTVLVNNISIANDIDAYKLAFEGDFDGPDPVVDNTWESRDAWVARYVPKADGVAAHLRDCYNHSTGERLKPHRIFVPIMPIADAEVSPAYNEMAEWVPILGGEGGETLTPDGVTQLRAATDEIGTGADAYSGDPRTRTGNPHGYGMMFLRAQAQGASGGGASSSYSLTASDTIHGDQTFEAVIQTAASSAFAYVDTNYTDTSDSAYSVMTVPASEPGRKQFGLMVEYMLNTSINFAALYGNSTAGSQGHFQFVNDKPRLRVISTSIISATSVQEVSTGVLYREVWLADLTKLTAAEVLQAMRNGSLLTFTGTIDATNTKDFDPAAMFTNLGVASYGGNGDASIDAQIGALWMHWGTGIVWPTLDQTFFDSFGASQIGDNGQNPLGATPKVFFTGEAGAEDGSDPDTWNATGGLINKGTAVDSLGNPLTLTRASTTPWIAAA